MLLLRVFHSFLGDLLLQYLTTLCQTTHSKEDGVFKTTEGGISLSL